MLDQALSSFNAEVREKTLADQMTAINQSIVITNKKPGFWTQPLLQPYQTPWKPCRLSTRSDSLLPSGVTAAVSVFGPCRVY